MREVRITFTDEEEFQKILEIIKANDNITSISKWYKNFKSKIPNEYRVYIKIQI